MFSIKWFDCTVSQFQSLSMKFTAATVSAFFLFLPTLKIVCGSLVCHLPLSVSAQLFRLFFPFSDDSLCFSFRLFVLSTITWLIHCHYTQYRWISWHQFNKLLLQGRCTCLAWIFIAIKRLKCHILINLEKSAGWY
jgi:hypothetical protein